jgi:hypothetical protein
MLLGVLLITAPVAAHHKDGHSQGGPAASNSKQADNQNDNGAAASKFGADDVDDCAAQAKNHGQFVSCVAHLVKAEGRGESLSASGIGFDGDECDGFANLVACAAHKKVGPDNGNDNEE